MGHFDPRQLSAVEVTRAPDRIVLREVVHLREVAARRPGGPSREAGGPRGHVGRDEPAGGQHLLVAPEAEVVRAALEQRDARVASEGAADERQIVLEQLLLKMAGAGGDHDPAAAGDGGNEVREGLAGPGSGLADEDVPLRHGTLDRGGHGPLLGTGRVARQQPRHGPVAAKTRSQAAAAFIFPAPARHRQTNRAKFRARPPLRTPSRGHERGHRTGAGV